jgi:NADH-quinone oxidoreductase subunit M
MDMLTLILVIFLGGAIVTWLGNKVNTVVGDLLFLAAIIIPAGMFFTGISAGTFTSLNVLGLSLTWGLSPLSYLFSLIVVGLGILAAIYAVPFMNGKDKKGAFYFNFILSIMSMLGILVSKDWISFFIFWEIMTWSSYLMVIINGKEVQKVGIKYFVFSAIGAYAMLMAMVILNSQLGSFMLADSFNNFQHLSAFNQILIPILLLIAFGVKGAMMPLHVWAPGAYGNAPMAYTSVFSGALSKMGIYGMVLVMVTMISQLPDGSMFRNVIAWLGGFTAAAATLWAITQDDGKKLLAWSSVGQMGYIIVGVAIGTPLAMLAALFLVVVHAIFKGSLFMVVGAIERQTGTTDFREVNGLIRKMPWTFISALLSIIALAGIPPLAGFVSKWMLYEALIQNNNYILVILLFFASTAGFLYSYKFLHGYFLGQEEPEWDHVKEAPIGMLVPMLILALGTFVLGTFPQLLFKPIDAALQYVGYTTTGGSLWADSVLFSKWGDVVMLQPILYAIIAVFVFFVIFLWFKGKKNTRYVSTKDISTSGEIPKEWENLTFKVNFFQPFERAIEPFLKRQIDKYYTAFGNGLEALFEFSRRVYTGNGQTYAIYAVLFLALLLLFKSNLFG